MATLGFSIGNASPVLFFHPQRSLKCLLHVDDFVVSGEPMDLVSMRNELEFKLEINTVILGDESGMSKEVKILNKSSVDMMESGILCSRPETRRSSHPRNESIQFDIFENPHVQREQGECARQNRRHCGEEKVGKIGHERTTTCRKDLEPCQNNSEKRIGSNCHFSCHWQRRHRVLCTRVDTSHGHANNNRLREGGEIGR